MIFHVPQAIPAFCGKRLIPNREKICILRCPRAGNYCASGGPPDCLTLPHAIRNGRDAEVFHHAIEIRCANASYRYFRSQSATLWSQSDFPTSGRMHPNTPPREQTTGIQVADSSLVEEGKRTSTSRPICLQTQYENCCCAVSEIRASRLCDGLQVSGSKSLQLACCNRLTVTQSAREGQQFCENFSYRWCRLCRWYSCGFARLARSSSDSI